MFVVSNRDLQVKLKEIRERVSRGEDAIHHSRGSGDLVIISLDRYNQMLDMLFREQKNSNEFLEETLRNQALLDKYVVLSLKLQEKNKKTVTDYADQKDLSKEWAMIKKQILKQMGRK